MTFKWLKRYMPRSLYGRAALILIVPIVTIQAVVSVVFIQRFYEDVTRQMTGDVVLELSYILRQIEAAPDVETAISAIEPLQEPLAMRLTLPAQGQGQGQNQMAFFDLSGRAMIDTLRRGVPGITMIDLVSNDDSVRLWVSTGFGDLDVQFPRLRVAARNPHQLLVLMLVTGVLMTIIAIMFLRNQLRPIKRLARASEAFGKGRVTVFNPTGATEVRAAGAAFLSMRGRIERQIEQRTLMLSGVSHDLRTPLTRLKLGLSMLDEDTLDLERDVADMEGLLDGFLDFARGDAGEVPTSTDPLALVKLAVANAHRAGKQVELAVASGKGEVMLRPKAVLRALENLIGNAVRYGNRAEVSVLLSERTLVISVEDDGPGIAPEDFDEALKPFSRLEPARNQNKGSGVGLGLSIALDIARAHGGALRLGESERLGGLQVDLILSR